MRISSQNRHESSQTTLATTLAALLVASMVSANEINGYGFRGYTPITGNDRLSFMGGAKMIGRADGGLSDQAGSNYMTYDF